MTHVSDSREQRDAEPLILAGVAARLGVKLRPCSLRLSNGARIDVDGAAEDESVFCEVYARQGRLRGAQPKKVASDALKLITLARNHPDARLVLAFADEAAAACVTGKSWLAETIRVWEIEVVVISLDPTVREELRDAQARQVMENPVVDARLSR